MLMLTVMMTMTMFMMMMMRKRHGLSTRCPGAVFLCFAVSLLLLRFSSLLRPGNLQMPWWMMPHLTLATFLMLWLQILQQGHHRPSLSMDPTLPMTPTPTAPRSHPARAHPRRRWNEQSASWWMNFSAWKSGNAGKRRTGWTRRQWPTWEDASFMATTCGVGKSWWRHSHDGYGG